MLPNKTWQYDNFEWKLCENRDWRICKCIWNEMNKSKNPIQLHNKFKNAMLCHQWWCFLGMCNHVRNVHNPSFLYTVSGHPGLVLGVERGNSCAHTHSPWKRISHYFVAARLSLTFGYCISENGTSLCSCKKLEQMGFFFKKKPQANKETKHRTKIKIPKPNEQTSPNLSYSQDSPEFPPRFKSFSVE